MEGYDCFKFALIQFLWYNDYNDITLLRWSHTQMMTGSNWWVRGVKSDSKNILQFGLDFSNIWYQSTRIHDNNNDTGHILVSHTNDDGM